MISTSAQPGTNIMYKSCDLWEKNHRFYNSILLSLLTLSHCFSGWGTVFHRGPPLCHWGATNPSDWTRLTMKSVAVHLSLPKIKIWLG